MRADVWLWTRKRSKGTTYAARWICPSTGKMKCEGCGKDKQLAKRMVEMKRAEIRAGVMNDPIKAGYEEFTEMVLSEMEREECEETSIVEARRVLGLFGMICEPRDVTAINSTMIARFDAERSQGAVLCSRRFCQWSNLPETEACWKCGEPIRGRVRTLAVRTRRKDLRTLHAAIERGRKRYRLAVDAFDGFRWPKADKILPKPVRHEEAHKLWGLVDDQWKAFIYIGATSGPRTGELCRLDWSDVDLDRRVLSLRRTKGNREQIKPLDDYAVELLRDLRSHRRIIGTADVPVFVRTEGRDVGGRWDKNYLKRAWGKYRDTAGVPHCRMHDLRKACATGLAVAGVNQRIANDVIGHSSTAVLEEYYQAAEIGVLREAVNKASAPLRIALGVG